jgi:dTDP-4-dehydrorhamnose reductase
MKVLLTGCQGQVGYYLNRQLKEKPWTLLACGRRELDISDGEAVADMVQSFMPNVIINAAAYTAVDRAESESELAFKVNADGPENLAKAAQKVNAALLHISTDYVFSGDKQGLYTEVDSVAPTGAYGASKLTGEAVVIKHCSRHIILRTSWVFGEHGQNFVKTMLRLGQDRKQLSVVADQFGGPTFAGDIAKALIKIVGQIVEVNANICWGVYHYSGLPHVSWFQFAETIFRQAQEQGVIERPPALSAIETSSYPTAAKRPANSALDCDKINQVFGIKQSDWAAALLRIKHYI